MRLSCQLDTFDRNAPVAEAVVVAVNGFGYVQLCKMLVRFVGSRNESEILDWDVAVNGL